MADQLLATKDLRGEIPTTRWSIVRALAGEASQRQQALEVFAQDYWPAIYAFARKKGHPPEEAEDVTQSFLSELIDSESFSGLSSDKGRFRSWLLACLHNYLRADWRDRGRQKRGGGAVHVSIDRDVGESWLEREDLAQLSPDAVFDRRWAAGILERAFTELARLYEQEGNGHVAEALVPLIAGGQARPSYATAAEKLEISESGARMAGFRLRKRLRSLVREEIAATVASSDDVEAELRELFAILAT